MRELIKELTNVLQSASDHLDYCGYGDSWERECARESKLEEKITASLEKANKFLEE